MAEEDREGRTQAATDKRRQQAREQGQAPLSREAVLVSGLAAATLSLMLTVPPASRSLALRLQALLENLDMPLAAALREAGMAILLALLPLAGAVLLASCLAVLLQTGWLIHTGALLPDLGRVDPRRGLRRLLGPDNLIEALKSLAKIGVLSWAAWRAVSDSLASSAASIGWDVGSLADQMVRHMLHLFLTVLGCQCAIALFDFGWVRFRFAQRLRMSPEEIKQEQKETDGDPRIKARIRQIRMARARRRMMAAVAKSAVVITNPTHYAVALAYERGVQAAPRVVAKGMDDLAARIREAAEQHGVPLVANPPLARALHQLPLDAEVPPEHFKAVAEVIAYVWRLRGAQRLSAGGR